MPSATGKFSFWDLANPTRFLSYSGKLLPWFIAATVITMTAGLYMAFFTAPPDYQQGETVRIMFIHVPSAWLAMMAYSIMTLSSIGRLVWKHPLADVSAKAAAPIGAIFTLCALITGSLWGKPMWGTWWVWDARLTSFLLLFIVYLGLVALWRTIEDPLKAGHAAAIMTLVGSVNIPIIKYSVVWWNTLHQPPGALRITGSSVDSSILIPLLTMAVAFSLLFLVLHAMAMRNEIKRRRIRTLHLSQAQTATGSVTSHTLSSAEQN
ncbi:MAG: heme ABC transporter permease [Cohaesibacteraceae bacterium]|nr:heme ABC transporter permease [Cohaesibacteraceae bacterium]